MLEAEGDLIGRIGCAPKQRVLWRHGLLSRLRAVVGLGVPDFELGSGAELSTEV